MAGPDGAMPTQPEKKRKPPWVGSVWVYVARHSGAAKHENSSSPSHVVKHWAQSTAAGAPA